MRLPNADRVQVDREKITEHLLSPDHPYGCNKAIFFTGFGFQLENWEVLAEALRDHVASNSPSSKRWNLISGRAILLRESLRRRREGDRACEPSGSLRKEAK